MTYLTGVNAVADLNQGLSLFLGSYVDAIYSRRLLDNIQNLGQLMFDI